MMLPVAIPFLLTLLATSGAEEPGESDAEFVGSEPAHVHCHASSHGHLYVSWDTSSASAYEVHVAGSATGEAFLAVHTQTSSADMMGLHTGRTYYVKVRSHDKGHRLDDGWSKFSSHIKCTVPKGAEGNVTQRSQDSQTSFHLKVVREAHGSSPDYLQEHDAANYEGEASFLKTHAHSPISQLMLFCVEVMHVHISGQTTTGGHSAFANYASCQKKGSSPYKCTKINDADCKWLSLSSADCEGARTDKSWEYSKKYVGLGVSKTSPGRSLFSFPRATECVGSERLGATKHDGAICTWKVREDFRLARGKTGMTEGEMSAAFSSAPMKAFECGSSDGPTLEASVFV